MLSCPVGSALQALSADEEVEEKEYEGSRRLKSSLNIKSKPKMKHQMGTYPRGRKLNLGKNLPASNEAQLLQASQFNGKSLSDVADYIASDEFTTPDNREANGAPSGSQRGAVRQSEGSVSAPSDAQQMRAASASQSGLSSGNGSAQGSSLAVRGETGSGQNGVEAKGRGKPDASNPLASRDAGEQAAARVSEPVAEEPEGQGLSLMW